MDSISIYVVLGGVCAVLVLVCRRIGARPWLTNTLMLACTCTFIAQTARNGHVVVTAVACAGCAVLAWWLVQGLGILVGKRESIAHALGLRVGRFLRRRR